MRIHLDDSGKGITCAECQTVVKAPSILHVDWKHGVYKNSPDKNSYRNSTSHNTYWDAECTPSSCCLIILSWWKLHDMNENNMVKSVAMSG